MKKKKVLESVFISFRLLEKKTILNSRLVLNSLRGPVGCARSRCIIMTLVALWSIQHDSEEREKNSTNYFEFWSRLIINSLVESMMVTPIGAIPKNRQVLILVLSIYFYRHLFQIFGKNLFSRPQYEVIGKIDYSSGTEIENSNQTEPCYMSVHGIFLKSINRTFSSCTWKV